MHDACAYAHDIANHAHASYELALAIESHSRASYVPLPRGAPHAHAAAACTIVRHNAPQSLPPPLQPWWHVAHSLVTVATVTAGDGTTRLGRHP